MKRFNSDTLLPIIVLMAVGMMVFPLPTAVLDVFLVISLSCSICLLLSAVYVPSPEKFTALPSIILLSTVFRLALNVATTRQLLTSGVAPQLVIAFGDWVIQGNIAAGIIVFLIVSIIQFLVVAKGAERVAEVAARFTLDAMPGKQMAIDADLRAGILTFQDARERRVELMREAKLYGSLDGAMKFVKGDAIAGLLITFVNLVAGFIIGCSHLGLAVGEAAKRYSIFTIGDGLVSQIPALLVAVSAGIVVTRVAEREGTLLGRDLWTQIIREPQALFLSAIACGVLAVMPGLPAIELAVVGLVFFAVAYQEKQRRTLLAELDAGSFRPTVSAPVVVYVPTVLAPTVSSYQTAIIEKVRERIFLKWGVLIAEMKLAAADDWGLEIRGIILPRFSGEQKNGELANVEPANVLANDTATILQQQVIEVIDANIHHFCNDTLVRTLLEFHAPQAEDLINSVIPAVAPITTLTVLLRQLLLERVSVRSIAVILQALAELELDGRIDEEASQIFLGCSGRSAALRSGETNLPAGLQEILSRVRNALRDVLLDDLPVRPTTNCLVLSETLDFYLGKCAFCGERPQMSLLFDIEKQLKEAQTRLGGNLILLCGRYSRTLISAYLRERNLAAVKFLAYDEISSKLNIAVQEELSISDPTLSLFADSPMELAA